MRAPTPRRPAHFQFQARTCLSTVEWSIRWPLQKAANPSERFPTAWQLSCSRETTPTASVRFTPPQPIRPQTTGSTGRAVVPEVMSILFPGSARACGRRIRKITLAGISPPRIGKSGAQLGCPASVRNGPGRTGIFSNKLPKAGIRLRQCPASSSSEDAPARGEVRDSSQLLSCLGLELKSPPRRSNSQ
jgi:hypothetical protein